jgi:hypothetical protein
MRSEIVYVSIIQIVLHYFLSLPFSCFYVNIFWSKINCYLYVFKTCFHGDTFHRSNIFDKACM